MSNALDHVRYNCGIAGEEVAEMVDALERQRDEMLANWLVEEPLRRQIAELKQQSDSLLAALIEMIEASEEPPDRNCSCHISPPCNDCVDYSCLREAFEMARSAIAKVGAGDTAVQVELLPANG